MNLKLEDVDELNQHWEDVAPQSMKVGGMLMVSKYVLRYI